MTGNFKVITACSSIGAHHVSVGLPCQDSSIAVMAPDYSLLVVADGMGSAPRSDEGACIAVTAARDYCKKARFFNIKRLVTYCRANVLRYARENGTSAEELHTTFLAVVIRGDSMYCAQVGDGAIVLMANDSAQRVFQQAFAEDKQPLNVTYSLLQQDFDQWLLTDELDLQEVQAVFAITDGLTPMAINYRDESAFPGFFNFFIEHILVADAPDDIISSRVAQFLASDALAAKSNDDKSLACWVKD